LDQRCVLLSDCFMLKKTPKDDLASWKLTSRDAPPHNGEHVIVLRGDRTLLPMIFHATPLWRWESPDGGRVFDFRYFDQWRRS
jgi:hypothetical protein